MKKLLCALVINGCLLFFNNAFCASVIPFNEWPDIVVGVVNKMNVRLSQQGKGISLHSDNNFSNPLEENNFIFIRDKYKIIGVIGLHRDSPDISCNDYDRELTTVCEGLLPVLRGQLQELLGNV